MEFSPLNRGATRASVGYDASANTPRAYHPGRPTPAQRVCFLRPSASSACEKHIVRENVCPSA